MSIQILGLRDYFDQNNELRKAERFFEKKWRHPSVAELFKNIDSALAEIPENEHYNLYYTACNCFEVKGRKLESQSIIPIDIDGIDTSNLEPYVHETCTFLNIPRDKVGVVASGNGLQFIIEIEDIIEDSEYFDEYRKYYKGMCGALSQHLFSLGLAGHVDPSVFSTGRLLRLPGTKNIKPKYGEKNAVLLQANIEPIAFDLVEASGIPVVSFDSQVSEKLLTRLPPVDAQGVQDGCKFLQWCKFEPEDVSEPQWYAMLSIIGRLPDGDKLAHEYSRGHSSYSDAATDRKREQALDASGPRTCENISTIWDGCGSCENYGKCRSPITLQSATYLPSQLTGFYNEVVDAKTGEKKRTKPAYDDLMQFFQQQHPFLTSEDGGMLYIFNTKCWEYLPISHVNAYAEKNFDPKPDSRMCSELRAKLQRNNLFNLNFFTVVDYINFDNGILSLQDGKLAPHSADFGFTYTLPFAYIPEQQCPRFDSFLDEITCGDTELQTVLLEYMGYSLSGMPCEIGQKALILTGDGSNGKSVFMDLLTHLAGEGNFSSLSVGKEISKLENRHQLDGKLFNVSEETPTNAMAESSVFKALVTGGIVQARKLYCDAYSMRNTAKLIMACNDLPPTNDQSHGMFRRLLIAPFNAKFDKDREGYDPHIRDKLYAESSGIFNKVLAALNGFKERGHFSVSTAVEDMVESYRMSNDSVNLWWDDCVLVEPDLVIESGAFYTAYKVDCELGGIKPVTNAQFTSRLAKLVPDSSYVRVRRGGKQQRSIKGFRLATGSDDDEI